METNNEVTRMRIYISSTDKYEHSPLYEVVVFAAKKHKIAGATVLKGIMGFGASSPISSQKLWELTEKLPLIIEIVDETEKIKEFLKIIRPYLEKVRFGSMITLEKVKIAFLKTGTKSNWDIFET